MTAGVGILSARVARSRDPRTIHSVFEAAQPLSAVGGAGWLVAGALGAAMASVSGDAFDSPWLVWSYGAFAILVVSGIGLHAPWQARVIRAAAASADGTVSADLDKLLRSPISPAASAISALCFIVLLYLMIARPG